jgi:hypothetical protein
MGEGAFGATEGCMANGIVRVSGMCGLSMPFFSKHRRKKYKEINLQQVPVSN